MFDLFVQKQSFIAKWEQENTKKNFNWDNKGTRNQAFKVKDFGEGLSQVFAGTTR